MSAVKEWKPISVEEYLSGELQSPVKHEYVGGAVYAMSGGSIRHSLIAVNTVSSLFVRLRGRRCQPFNSDMKIRVRTASITRFYYPDASVVCRSNPETDSFQDEPRVVFEILSRSTRRIDEGEKKDFYQSIPSLNVYVLIEQDTDAVALYRRTEQGFVRETYVGMEAIIPLPEIGTELPLAEIYERVAFTPEPEEEEESENLG